MGKGFKKWGLYVANFLKYWTGTFVRLGHFEEAVIKNLEQTPLSRCQQLPSTLQRTYWRHQQERQTTDKPTNFYQQSDQQTFG